MIISAPSIGLAPTPIDLAFSAANATPPNAKATTIPTQDACFMLRFLPCHGGCRGGRLSSMSPLLTPEMASHFAKAALSHVRREYPHKLDHVLDGDGDAVPPRVLHPLFHGSFDWHSCAHGHWLLARVLR